jgi:hypothetical protein
LIKWIKVPVRHVFSVENVFLLEVVQYIDITSKEGRKRCEEYVVRYNSVYTKKLPVCFQEFNAMLKNSIPEIQRCNLTNIVLQLLALKIDTLTFDFMDVPPREVSFFCISLKYTKLNHNYKPFICMFHLKVAHKINKVSEALRNKNPLMKDYCKKPMGNTHRT